MVYIAGDKHGYKAISCVENFLKSQKILFENLGVHSEDEEMKLEDMIPRVVLKVKRERQIKESLYAVPALVLKSELINSAASGLVWFQMKSLRNGRLLKINVILFV